MCDRLLQTHEISLDGLIVISLEISDMNDGF